MRGFTCVSTCETIQAEVKGAFLFMAGMTDLEEFQRQHRIQKAFDEKRCVASYQWCLRQVEEDVKNDGFLLRRVPSLGAYTFTQTTQSLSPKRRVEPVTHDAEGRSAIDFAQMRVRAKAAEMLLAIRGTYRGCGSL